MALHKSFRATWPLFAALALVMAGNGLYGTLSGIRASQEGYGPVTVGAIMSFLFGGYIAGCFAAPALIRQAGHIRTFMAMAVVAAVAILAQDGLHNFMGWSAGRFVTGFCFAVIYITVESWLNGTSDNVVRGRMMGLYMFVLYGAMVAGQYMPGGTPQAAGGGILFAPAALAVALGPLPLLFSRNPGIPAPPAQRLNLLRFRNIPPLGFYGVLTAGIGVGALLTLAPAHAAAAGMDARQVAHFMAAFILGGMAGQIPLGHLSDRIGRIRMIAAVSLMAALSLFWCLQAMAMAPAALYAALFCAGAFSLNLYGQCAAYINDRLPPDQIVDTGAAQILVNGIGSFMGPFLISVAIAHEGSDAFFISLSVIYILSGLFALAALRPRQPFPEG